MTPCYAVHYRAPGSFAWQQLEHAVCTSPRDVFEVIDAIDMADMIGGDPRRLQILRCIPAAGCEDVTADILRQYADASRWPAWLVDYAPEDIREEINTAYDEAAAADARYHEREAAE